MLIPETSQGRPYRFESGMINLTESVGILVWTTGYEEGEGPRRSDEGA